MVEETKATKTTKAATNDIWNTKVKIRIPKIPGEENYMFVALNGRAFKLQRGKEVEVPKAIAEIIEDSMEKQEMADEFIDSIKY